MKLRKRNSFKKSDKIFSIHFKGNIQALNQFKRKEENGNSLKKYWKDATKKISLHGIHFLGDYSLGSVEKYVQRRMKKYKIF